jgi:hypothetical protein
LVHVTEYVVFVAGETEALPEVAPPVEKLVPVQEAAFEEDHERVVLPPTDIVAVEAESAAVGVNADWVAIAETIVPLKPVQSTSYFVSG